MRTISALIAATLCALALSGSAIAADGGPTSRQAIALDWLEFRTAFAAEELWPGKVVTTKSGRAQSPGRDIDALWPAALLDTANLTLRQGLDVSRNQGQFAERLLSSERSSFDIAGH